MDCRHVTTYDTDYTDEPKKKKLKENCHKERVSPVIKINE